MPDPITTPTPPIPIEETPEIPMEPSAQPHVPPPPPMPSAPRGTSIITIIIFIILFIAGIFLSSYIRQLFPGRGTAVVKPTPVVPTPTPADPFAGWNTFTLAGLSYKLPADVLAPTCDGAACISQGTYLPGGTRFTVASRGPSAFVTDANGVAFVNKDATVSGHTATEFIGTFSGKTITGYRFTQMHGFMIAVSPSATLEINHFTPAGVTADWARDDVLFTQIVSTLNLSSVLAPTPTATLILTPTITAAPIATATPRAATSSGN